MSENVRYWLWLQNVLGCAKSFKSIIEEFGSVKALYDANILDYKMSPSLTQRNVDALACTNIACADNIIDTCKRNGWQIIDYDDEAYPKRLKEIPDPPSVIYVDGELPDIDGTAVIGIVGTRRASDYSAAVTDIMSRGCTDAGALVISGGALGIDSQAHLSALSAGGKTVAVLGSGFGDSYLKSNKALRDRIRENGALITEFPPFTRASKVTFPQRNRIISGLSIGVLVVEAGIRSGSLITADCALEQGRDVFAVPASILSPAFAGTNKLIDNGAIVATKPLTIVETYANQFESIDTFKVKSVEEYMKTAYSKNANSPTPVPPSFDVSAGTRDIRSEREVAAGNLKGDLLTVYSCLNQSFENIDFIISNTQLPSSRVLSALTQLELMGLAVGTSGRRYKKS